MNILATIRAEFLHRKGACERVQDDLRNEENKDYYKGKAVAYEEALAYIDSLSPWVPASKPPKPGVWVFACSNVNGIPQGVRVALYVAPDVWVNDEDIVITGIDYWMPIPPLKTI